MAGDPIGKKSRSALYYAPRLLGLGLALYLALFALDVFSEGYEFGDLVSALLIHLLPSLMILIVVGIAWRWERIGGALFVLLGVLYMVIFWDPVRWVAYLFISLPLILVGALFWLHSWLRHDRLSQNQGEEKERS